jgi:hypothetical protein
MCQDENPLRARRTMVFTFALLCALGLSAACRPRGDSNTATGGANSNTSRKEFTEAEVAEIRTLLNGVDPSRYRVTVPQYREGRVEGFQTLGTLSLTEVERVASARGIKFDEKGTAMLVLDLEESSGGGAGTHTPSQSSGDKSGSTPPSDPKPPTGGGSAGITPSRGLSRRDRYLRLEELSKRIGESRFIVIQ